MRMNFDGLSGLSMLPHDVMNWPGDFGVFMVSENLLLSYGVLHLSSHILISRCSFFHLH